MGAVPIFPKVKMGAVPILNYFPYFPPTFRSCPYFQDRPVKPDDDEG